MGVASGVDGDACLMEGGVAYGSMEIEGPDLSCGRGLWGEDCGCLLEGAWLMGA